MNTGWNRHEKIYAVAMVVLLVIYAAASYLDYLERKKINLAKVAEHEATTRALDGVATYVDQQVRLSMEQRRNGNWFTRLISEKSK